MQPALTTTADLPVPGLPDVSALLGAADSLSTLAGGGPNVSAADGHQEVGGLSFNVGGVATGGSKQSNDAASGGTGDSEDSLVQQISVSLIVAVVTGLILRASK